MAREIAPASAGSSVNRTGAGQLLQCEERDVDVEGRPRLLLVNLQRDPADDRVGRPLTRDLERATPSLSVYHRRSSRNPSSSGSTITIRA